jgi:Tol biopolymer transport system component
VIVSCSGGNDNDVEPATHTPTPAPLPEGIVLYRDGIGDLVALDLATGDGFRRSIDVTNEALITAGCSRDGSRIAYLRQDFDDVRRELTTVGDDGERTFSLPPGTQGIAWSPDGSQIAYSVFTPNAGYSFSIIDIATGDQREQFRGPGVAGSPRWSPDGTLLAFHAPAGPVSQIWLYEIDSGAESPSQATESAGSFDPDWSLDGNKLLISGVAEDQSFQIFELDTNTGESTQLTDSDAFKRLPRYSPDGSAVAYTGQAIVPVVSRVALDLHQFGVCLMAADGSSERALTADPQLNPGAAVDPFLDAILVGWCTQGPWLDESWIEDSFATPVAP